MKKFRVFISGQKYFGAEAFRACQRAGLEIVAVCCPLDDKYLGQLARINGVPIVAAGTLTAGTLPPHIDLGITAHSWDYIGKKTRYATRVGWIGYHPSLLPRHRGKSAVEWAIRMGDPITGGSVFWLNAGIDRGDIERQEWCFVDPALRVGCPKKAAKKLWREELLLMGVRLLEAAVKDISAGIVHRVPQDARFGTFEPCTDVKDLYRPDLLMIPERAESAV